MADTFSGFYKTPSSSTVYGVADGGQRVAFQTPEQLAQAQGLPAVDFSKVTTDASFNPAGAVLYPDYQKTLPAPSTTSSAALPGTVTYTPLTLPKIDTYSTNLLGSDTTSTDIQKFFKTQQDTIDKITALSTPSDKEQKLTDELRTFDQSERAGINAIQNKPIPMPFITGEQAGLQRQATLDRLAISENLQAETNKRMGSLESLKNAFGFGEKNLEDLLGVDKQFRSIAADQRTQARNTLNDIITLTKGMTWDQLSPTDQNNLATLAVGAGMSQDIVKKAMENNQIAVMEEAVKNAQSMGVTSRFYTMPGDSTVFDLFQGGKPVNIEEYKKLTGQTGVNDSQVDFKAVQQLRGTSKAEQAEVVKLANTYPDAGIDINKDSYAAASAKVTQNSRIYAQHTRLVSGGGGSGSGTGTGTGSGSGTGMGTGKGGGGGGTPKVTYKFTNAQINKGSNNAGLDLGSFRKLDPQIQNFYVSSSAAVLKGLNEAIGQVKSGSISLQDFNDAVDGNNVSDVVKSYIKQKAAAIAPPPKPQRPGFWSQVWTATKQTFGIK